MKIKDIKILSHTIGNDWDNPFLIHHQYRLQNIYDDLSISESYTNEFFDRKGLDCVAVIPYIVKDYKIHIGFLNAFRPPVYMRRFYKKPVDEKVYFSIYESVAGSLEENDKGLDGLAERARLELLEEAGIHATADNFKKLGGSFFPSHGQSTEKIHLFSVNVTGLEIKTPSGDGSINEGFNEFIIKPIETVKDMCFKGLIEDPKIEIGVYRLENHL